MEFVRSLRQLVRHRLFRRLLSVRVATQTADGVLQVALASFVLFSPQRQPDAASVATVLAVTLLPFSILGPFVGVVLDRWSRRQILVVLDLARAVLAVGLAALVGSGLRTGWSDAAFYAGVLLAMSLNRFLLAALSAALPHTIDAGEYMVANSVMPTIGPLGTVVGVGLGTTLRVVLGNQMADYQANGVLFCLAAGGWLISTALALRIPRDALGPDRPDPALARDVVRGLVEALAHLKQRRPAGLGLITIGLHRVAYGVVTVAMILVFRNYLNAPTDVNPALADLGLLAVITAAGFVAAAAVTPPLSVRWGVRRLVVVAFLASAVFQLLPGAIFAKVPLLVAGFLLGITAQSIKLCVDTLVQAHVDDEFKGRVFVLYDMIFNVALVVAAGIGAVILPANGVSVPIIVGLAVAYALLGLGFALVTRRLSMDEGTESLRGETAEPVAGA
ncbi:MFS transporter [Microlunatus aurantiacus]|uniref:MFS transporter n=1 Tax=Microlunatus aurantiacus TaxID=446786 RepID=A0ABP7DAU9_9ACTN